MRSSFLATLVVASAIAGCAELQPTVKMRTALDTEAFRDYEPHESVAKMQTDFDIEAHREYEKTGPNSVSGQVFFRQKSGDIMTCAGNDVYLLPDTPYFQEFIDIWRAGADPNSANDPTSLGTISRMSPCDAQGNFAFKNLPSAQWFLGTTVEWVERYKRQAWTLIKRVTTANGEALKVLLEGDELHPDPGPPRERQRG